MQKPNRGEEADEKLFSIRCHEPAGRGRLDRLCLANRIFRFAKVCGSKRPMIVARHRRMNQSLGQAKLLV